MRLETLPDSEAVARRAAEFVAASARSIVAMRGKFVLAVSGGSTPWQMLRALADDIVPWDQTHIVQVDERVAPPEDADRNLTHLRESLLAHAPLPESHLHAMPVNAEDLEEAAWDYARKLAQIAGPTPVIDLVHLGLGPDGHTAPLVPGDPALEVSDRDVAIVGEYQGRRRMTLTYPIINRARGVLWLVTGASKREMLVRLLAGDKTIPAGRVCSQQALILADRAAAAE